MKKIIISSVIIIAFCTTIFFIGLIHIPENNYAVIHTKLWGYEEQVYKPKTYLWRWEKLFPTVFTLYTFNLTPFHTEVELDINANLISSGGSENPGAVEENTAFSFSIIFYVKFSLLPEKLIQMVKEGLTPERLDMWYHDLANLLAEKMSSVIVEDPYILNLKKKEFLTRIRSLAEQEQELNVLNLITIEPKSLQIPDYDAYISLKSWFIDYLDEKISILQTEKERHIREIETEIDEIIYNIKTYKEILIKYPLIVDFLYMNREGITVQSFEEPGEEEK